MNPRKTYALVSYAGITRIRFTGLGVRLRRLSREYPAPLFAYSIVNRLARFVKGKRQCVSISVTV